MPRQGRIDFPGALHHVIIRGINKAPIFYDDKDRGDFVRRLSNALERTKLLCYAWALIPNHVHLLLETVSVPLGKLMRSLLTGYAIRFNRRHKRVGYLFQNRYKSILCDTEEYLLQLVSYIHLNPLRAKLVSNIEELDKYPWCGHSILMGYHKAEWQETNVILRRFGSTLREARTNYRNFIIAGIAEGSRPDLNGGGLIRSVGGWESVKRLRKSRERWRGDERILGNSDFVLRVLDQAGEQLTERQWREIEGVSLAQLFDMVTKICKVNKAVVRKGKRVSACSRARALFSFWAMKELGSTPTELATYLSVSRAAVYKAVTKGQGIVESEKLKFPLK